jgi:hypothetical protein
MSSTTNDSKPDAATLVRAEGAKAEDAKAPGLPIGVYGQSTYGHCRSPTRDELAKNVERSGQPAPEPSIEKTEA